MIPKKTEMAVDKMKADLVKLGEKDGFAINLVFKSVSNPLQKRIYPEYADLYVDKIAAEKLFRVRDELFAYGYILCIGDGYRPLRYQKLMKTCVSDDRYVSSEDVAFHCRGVAVDVVLLSITTKELIPLPPISHDQMSHHGVTEGLSPEQTSNREFLKGIMVKNGFEPYQYEWWHYNLTGWQEYDILDVDFCDIPLIPIVSGLNELSSK